MSEKSGNDPNEDTEMFEDNMDTLAYSAMVYKIGVFLIVLEYFCLFFFFFNIRVVIELLDSLTNSLLISFLV